MASLLKPYTRLTRASCSTLVMFGLLLVVAPHVFVHAEWKFLSAFSPSRCPRFSSQSYQSLMSGLLANNTNKCELGIFAQDMPLHTISLAISEFLARPQASKPLTLVLAGPNGVGKTMTERRLRDILHKKTIWSDARKGFQVFNGGHVGDSNPSYLVEAIGKQIKDCPTSIIVIDELQFLPVPTIEALAIFFDSAQPVRVSPTLNVDASKSIFLFTTNSMFALINARTKSLLKTKKRNELKYFDFEDILKQGFAESSTSWLSYKNLMDYYIPLLPVTLEDAKQFISKLLKVNKPASYVTFLMCGFYTTNSHSFVECFFQGILYSYRHSIGHNHTHMLAVLALLAVYFPSLFLAFVSFYFAPRSSLLLFHFISLCSPSIAPWVHWKVFWAFCLAEVGLERCRSSCIKVNFGL
eukprot:m.51985 g.51985  ORF g.51985 m.51985 type:complete len:411 (+) comp11276_c0_seq1:129-1361(+)